MSGLRALALGLDRWVAKAEAAVIVLLVTMLTAVTFAQVCARYVLGDPLIWSEEAARYLFVWVSMIGAALALREGAHFGLDLLIRRAPALKPVLGPSVAIVTALFLLILLKTGIDETRLASRQLAMTFPMHMQWAYLALPTGAALMLFHLAMHVVRAPGMHILDIRRDPE
ncbi:MAG TPA: TRAP transporter small permease [Xanthobacteraceae bacterium]|jgi:TRAP-type C4-dicarboxylate transport system permease small subunit